MLKDIKFYHNKSIEHKFPKYNLVYVSGVPQIISDKEVLKSEQFFGHYGKIQHIQVLKDDSFQENQSSDQNATCQVYITYERIESACIAILALDNSELNNQKLKAYFGITKLCWHVFHKRKCRDTKCLFVHYFDQDILSQSTKQIINKYCRMRRNKLIRFFLALEKSQNFIVQNIQHKFDNVFLPSKKISLWKVFNYAKNNCSQYYKELLSQITQHRTQSEQDEQISNVPNISFLKLESSIQKNDQFDKENKKNAFRKRILDVHNHQRSLSSKFKHRTN